MPQMNQSLVRTVTVPGVPTNNPAQVAVAMFDRPMRVVVDNVGAVAIRLAFASASLGGATAEAVDHYQLQVGRSQVFVLSPGQKMFAVGVGATGLLSIHTSDALPFDLKV